MFSGECYFTSNNDYFIAGVDYHTSRQGLKEVMPPACPNYYLVLCQTHTHTHTNQSSTFILGSFLKMIFYSINQADLELILNMLALNSSVSANLVLDS